MLTLALIFAGAGVTLLGAYGAGSVLLRKVQAPPEIVLAVGAVFQSFLVFLLMLGNAADWRVFLAVGAVEIAALRWFRAPALTEPSGTPLSRNERIAAAVIFGAYGLWYFVNALAPEVFADGISYHLGLPYEYVRLGGFPDRIAFYDMIPQGMEMLYTEAFAFGQHSAAKLVEFTFFLSTLPLIFRIGRRLRMSDRGSLVAAVLYFCAPIVGLTGSSSYNDAALVFFTLAAFYLLLVWRDSSESYYLLAAGALAGFCYALKFPGIFTVGAAMLFVAGGGRPRSRRTPRSGSGDALEAEADEGVGRGPGGPPHGRFKATAWVVLGASVVMAPWLIRNFAITGDPGAPLMNAVFPNPYFHMETEHDLAVGMRSLGHIAPIGIPWELAFGDHFTGTFGPLVFLLPLALIALRSRTGRLCLAAAAVLALAWLSNTGARFLMPAFAVAALALGMVLPRPAAWAAIAMQAVICWPQLLNTWQPSYIFRLHEFPLRAALRIEPEADYIPPRAPEYNVAKMVERATPPDARILALEVVANAYLARDARVFWQSADADRMIDVLRLSSMYADAPLYDWKATWPIESLRALRFRLPASHEGEWDITEAQLFSGLDRIYNSPQWTLRGWPNPWEAPLAFDNDPATRWRTWQPMRIGMYLEVDLDHPQRLDSASLFSHTPLYGVPLEFYGQDPNGKWHLLSNKPAATLVPNPDLRIATTAVLRRAGYRYVLAPAGVGGNAPVGNALLAQSPKWGMEEVAHAGPYHLFRIK